MEAKLKPLKGKYYGTVIEITDNDIIYPIKLWDIGSGEPSDRELKGVCTIDQWRNNERMGDGKLAKDKYDVYDSHFESRETYATAQKLVKLINNSEV